MSVKQLLEELEEIARATPRADLPPLIRELEMLKAAALVRMVREAAKEGCREAMAAGAIAWDDVRLLKPAEAAKLLGYSVGEVYAKMKAGVIPWITLDGDGDRRASRRIPLFALRRMISDRFDDARECLKRRAMDPNELCADQRCRHPRKDHVVTKELGAPSEVLGGDVFGKREMEEDAVCIACRADEQNRGSLATAVHHAFKSASGTDAVA